MLNDRTICGFLGGFKKYFTTINTFWTSLHMKVSKSSIGVVSTGSKIGDPKVEPNPPSDPNSKLRDAHDVLFSLFHYSQATWCVGDLA